MSPFTQLPARQVRSLGEIALISEIRRWLGRTCPASPAGIGDDCAVLPPTPRAALLTVDPVVYGVHLDASVPARQVGRKLLSRNLSDIAAMGGRPRAALVALALDPSTDRGWLEAFYRGIAEVARRHRVQVIGGDVTTHTGFAATLTLVGEAGARTLTRRGARVGDRIYVTGTLGRSLSTGHHHRFTPRLAEGAWLARQPEVRSMIDVSDGIGKDVASLSPAKGEALIDPESLPRRSGASVAQALSDGEDYELLFSVRSSSDRASFERRWRRRFPSLRLSLIGRFVASGSSPTGATRTLAGYEHLR